MKESFGITAIVLTAVLSAIVSPVRADMVFSWSFESETPEVFTPGSDSTPQYYPDNRRTTVAARSGDYSLDMSGGYNEVSFENPTNNNVWAKTDEGAISLWWKYTDVFTGGRMLCKIDGGCPKTAPELDTNEALTLGFRNSMNQLQLTYGRIDDTGYHTTNVRYTHPEAWVADHWYNVVFKWDTATAPSLFLQVDGGTPKIGGAAIGSTTMQAFHGLIWGNDLNISGGPLYVDDVQIWDDFEMTPEPASAALLLLGALGLVRRKRAA